ncbi:MAG: hypothetical protein U0002_09460 [Thermoanaerobaculia bacterium]
MRKTSVLALALLLLAGASVARAEIGTIDNVPAATLLLPYFEVDLDNADGVTTLFSINNASATAVLPVTLWTDLSVPTLDFNVYLTGYDVQTFNLRDLFTTGSVPRTASVGQDPGDTISPKGIYSQDINFASCNNQLPRRACADFDHIRAAHTGQLRRSSSAASARRGPRRQRRPRLRDDRHGELLQPGVPASPGYFTNRHLQNAFWATTVNSAENSQGDHGSHRGGARPDPMRLGRPTTRSTAVPRVRTLARVWTTSSSPSSTAAPSTAHLSWCGATPSGRSRRSRAL